METLGSSAMCKDIHSLCVLKIWEDPKWSVYFVLFRQETSQAFVSFVCGVWRSSNVVNWIQRPEWGMLTLKIHLPQAWTNILDFDLGMREKERWIRERTEKQAEGKRWKRKKDKKRLKWRNFETFQEGYSVCFFVPFSRYYVLTNFVVL